MFKEIESALIWGAAATAASTWASRRMTPPIPPTARPVWQGELNDQVITVIEHANQGRVCYELCAIADGRSVLTGWYPTYPQCLAAVQAWDLFLRAGGTVAQWVAHYFPPAPEPALPRYGLQYV